MLAINWFEVFLPSRDLTIQVESFADSADVPEKISKPNHRTVLRRQSEGVKRHHITFAHVNTADSETFEAVEDADLTKQILELGFTSKLAEAGFYTTPQRVGGVGTIETEGSLLPEIYRTSEGLRYRAFFFVDENAIPQRWGMVLNFITRQQFVLTLADENFQRSAVGKHVVPALSSVEENRPEAGLLGKQTFVGSQNSHAVLENPVGEQHTVPLHEWTLPASKWILRNVVDDLFGSTKANEVSLRLNQDALSLTAGHHINKTLARDQIEKVRQLVRNHDLVNFRLPLPEQLYVRMSEAPLDVST